jgi:ABC-2 type transport system ATP-binding protein
VGVDPQSRSHIVDSIRRLSEEHGMTVLYTTHYMEEA